MTIEEYRKLKINDDPAPGWDCIDDVLVKLYPDQEPQHWGTVIPMMLGGEDPLQGVSAYKSESQESHIHYCSYGFTELFYDEEAFGKDFSKFGFELTFRLKKSGDIEQDDAWVVSLMQNLAKYVFSSGNWFEEYHWIPANSPIKGDSDTKLVAIAFCIDPELPAINTPHGRVEFLQMFGITQEELDTLGKPRELTKELLDKHRKANPLLLTDLSRKELSSFIW